MANQWDAFHRQAQEERRARKERFKQQQRTEALQKSTARAQAKAGKTPQANIDKRLGGKTAAPMEYDQSFASKVGQKRLQREGALPADSQARVLAARNRAVEEEAAATPAAPATDPTTRRPLAPSTRVGAMSGVTGFSSAAEQLQKLRAMRDAEEPARETVNRGFQYQPSQWAQQVAARNARMDATQRVRDPKTGRMVEVFDQDVMDAAIATDPRLQGLERAKMFQDTRDVDLASAQRQRAQDMGFRSRQNEARTELARSQMQADASLAGEKMRGEYGLREAQVRADNDMAQARLKAQIDRYGQDAETSQQNFENIQTLVTQYAGEGEDAGRKATELTNFLTNSQIFDTREAQAGLALYDQFSRSLQEAGEVAESSHPVFARLFDWFKANKGKARNMAQLKADMKQAIDDPEFARAFKGDKSYKSFLTSIRRGLKD